MKIAFIGGGQIAEAIAALARPMGHESIFGVRNPAIARATAFPRTSFAEDIVGDDIVTLAVPYLATARLLPPLADALADNIVIDTTNAVKPDWSPLPTGEECSGAEHMQALLPTSRIVKAFNTIFVNVLRPDRLDRDGQRISLFVANDDINATRVVMD